MLPWKASFGGRSGHQRLGHHVTYYKVTDNPTPRWVCPDLIATSKLEFYRWQDEFRLLFSLTDALRFEIISGRIVVGNARELRIPQSITSTISTSGAFATSRFYTNGQKPLQRAAHVHRELFDQR
jgi:hypothetical protein